ncbi:MAG: flagellar hook-basal body complex protein FliE [Pirellulales bacterium]
MNTINTPQIATPPPLLNPALGNNTAETGETSFKDMLFDSFQEVNNMQLDADKAVNEMFTGGDVSPAEVLTAVQKADLAFRLTMQMRNKLMEVYQEVRDIRI